jgi:hypothetical protein
LEPLDPVSVDLAISASTFELLLGFEELKFSVLKAEHDYLFSGRRRRRRRV